MEQYQSGKEARARIAGWLAKVSSNALTARHSSFKVLGLGAERGQRASPGVTAVAPELGSVERGQFCSLLARKALTSERIESILVSRSAHWAHVGSPPDVHSRVALVCHQFAGVSRVRGADAAAAAEPAV
jgi:hypothetical protein